MGIAYGKQTGLNDTITHCMGYLSCHGNDTELQQQSSLTIEDGRVMLITGFINKLMNNSSITKPTFSHDSISSNVSYYSIATGIPLDHCVD